MLPIPLLWLKRNGRKPGTLSSPRWNYGKDRSVFSLKEIPNYDLLGHENVLCISGGNWEEYFKKCHLNYPAVDNPKSPKKPLNPFSGMSFLEEFQASTLPSPSSSIHYCMVLLNPNPISYLWEILMLIIQYIFSSLRFFCQLQIQYTRVCLYIYV